MGNPSFSLKQAINKHDSIFSLNSLSTLSQSLTSIFLYNSYKDLLYLKLKELLNSNSNIGAFIESFKHERKSYFTQSTTLVDILVDLRKQDRC